MYNAYSPYKTTNVVNNQYLDIMNNRTFFIDESDIYWTITPTYHLRPDLLAYDLYENSMLWWVFAQRNPNTLTDPFFDFVEGTQIYLPQLNSLKAALGF